MANLFERTKISVLAKQQRDKRDDRYAARVVSETATVVSPKTVMVGSTIYRAAVPGAVAGEQIAVVDQGGGSALYTPANASIVGGSRSSGSTGGTGGAAMTQHDITGSYHAASGLTTGQVIKATSPTTFGWRSLLWSEVDKTTSSIADIATRSHSLLTGIGANDHHNQQHILATTSALGADHTVSGLTTGQVLRATSATTAAFGSVLWSEVNKTTSSIADITTKTHSLLTGLTGSDDHTQYVHNTIARSISAQHTFAPGSAQAPFLLSANAQGQTVVGLKADQLNRTVTAGAGLSGAGALTSDITVNMGTPSSITVATTNSASGATHSHAVVSSNNPGTNASLLASDLSGRLTLPLFVATTSVTTPSIVTASGNLAITPAGTHINLSTSKTLQSSDYVSGWAGSGYRIDSDVSVTGETFAEFDNLSVRGTMRVYELLINQIRATNGTLIISSAGKIDSVSGSNWTFEDPEGSNLCPFLANDLVIIQNVDLDASTIVKRIVRRVTAVSGKTITVTAASGGPTDAGTPAKGDTVVRFGNSTNAARQGVVLITSDFVNAPYMDVVSGVTSWADWTGGAKTKVRLGNLTGITGTANEYGLIAGDSGFTSSDSYVKFSSAGVLQNNVDTTWTTGGTTFASIDSTNGFRVESVNSTSASSQRAYSFTISGIESGGIYHYHNSTYTEAVLAATQYSAARNNNLFILCDSDNGKASRIYIEAREEAAATASIDFLSGVGASVSQVSIAAGHVEFESSQVLARYANGSGGDGFATAPIYTFIDDPNTGIYRSAADTLNFATGGANQLSITTSSVTSNQPVIVTGGGELIRLNGSVTGNSSTAYISFYDSGGTRIGYIGDASAGNSDLYLRSETGNLQLGDSSAGGILVVSAGDVTVLNDLYADTVLANERFVAGGAELSGNVSKYTGRYSTQSGISLTATSWGYASAVLFNAYQADNSVRLSASGGCKYLGAQYTGNVTAPGMFYYDANSNRFEWWIGEQGLASGANITAWAEQLRLDSAGKLTLFGDLEWSSGGFAAGWTNLTYNTNWSSFSGSFANAKYCKIGDLVLVNGLVKRTSGNTTTTVCTLPSGYRPTTQKSFYTRMSVDGVESAYRVDVATSGAVAITYASTGAIDALSLDCIQFRTNS